jgi:hypothetical protein
MCPRTKENYDIDVIKELNTCSPISSLDDPCCMSDIIENIPSFELDYSFIFDGVGSDIPLAPAINDCDKDSTQFISDATRK